jgi:hypothetical protein
MQLERMTSAAPMCGSPATSVSHTNASMPGVAPIPCTNRRSRSSALCPRKGARASVGASGPSSDRCSKWRYAAMSNWRALEK